MDSIDNIHLRHVEEANEAAEVAGWGIRIADIGVAVLIGLLVCPPLAVLAFVAAASALAVAAAIAAVLAPFILVWLLVRRVLGHHREHGVTLFVHKLLPSRLPRRVAPRQAAQQ
jgi:hypothetical protein